MTDPGFILAAYTVVLGGLGGYVVTLDRRGRAARRLLEAVARQQATEPGDERPNAPASDVDPNTGASDAEGRGPGRSPGRGPGR